MTPKGHCLLKHVHELIDPSSGVWDADLIRSIFWDIDARQILAIPLSQNGMGDFVAWKFSKNGLFSVRSAYHMEWESTFGVSLQRSDGTGSSGLNTIWRDLRKCAVPAKVKFFTWKCLHGILPCYDVLVNRHIMNNSTCPVCKRYCEDIKHVIFQCEEAKGIWQKIGLIEVVTEACQIDRSGSAVLDYLMAGKLRAQLMHQ